MENLTASDVAAVTNRGGYGDYGFGGGGIWLFAILALMWGRNWNNNEASRAATVEDLANQSNFTRLENQVQGGFSNMNERLTNLGNGICSLGYDMASKFGDVTTKISDCCCNINRNIDGVRYENAMNTAAINANTTAQVQKVLDALCQQELARREARINQLELNQALCGVMRYPTTATYNAGYPFYNGCNNNI